MENKNKYKYEHEKPITTYQKVSISISELVISALPIYTIIYVWIEFFNETRGFISTSIWSTLSIWILCEFYDISWRKAKRKKH